MINPILRLELLKNPRLLDEYIGYHGPYPVKSLDRKNRVIIPRDLRTAFRSRADLTGLGKHFRLHCRLFEEEGIQYVEFRDRVSLEGQAYPPYLPRDIDSLGRLTLSDEMASLFKGKGRMIIWGKKDHIRLYREEDYTKILTKS